MLVHGIVVSFDVPADIDRFRLACIEKIFYA